MEQDKCHRPCCSYWSLAIFLKWSPDCCKPLVNFQSFKKLNIYIYLCQCSYCFYGREKFWWALFSHSHCHLALFSFFKIFIYLFKIITYLFIFGCVGPSLLHRAFLSLRRLRATFHCVAWSPHGDGFSSCGAWALDMHVSVVVMHGLRSCGSQALEHWLNSWAHGLSCLTACSIFLDRGLNWCPLHCKMYA